MNVPRDLLASSPLLVGLDRQALRTVADALIEERWAAGRQIVGPSGTTGAFRLVIEGRVKVTVSNSSDGKELTLWLLGPGDGFDVVSLLDGKPHAIDAWALDEVKTLRAPMVQWRAWIERFRPLDLAMHRYAAERLREITELAADLALHDTSTRLTHLLLRRFGARRNSLLQGLPQRELASMIGSVRIVVSRLLARMRHYSAAEVQIGPLSEVDQRRLLLRAESELARPASPSRRRANRSKR